MRFPTLHIYAIVNLFVLCNLFKFKFLNNKGKEREKIFFRKKGKNNKFSKEIYISFLRSRAIRHYLQSPQQEDWDSSTVCSALKHFERLVETTRMTLLGPGCRETLTSALETVVERTQDFTDSAYTSHEHRENILLLCDRAKLELNTLLRIGNSMVSRNFSFYFTGENKPPNNTLSNNIV